MRKLALTLIALLLFFLGAYGLVLTPFLPLIYLDLNPPGWLGGPLPWLVSGACIGAGVLVWRKRTC